MFNITLTECFTNEVMDVIYEVVETEFGWLAEVILEDKPVTQEETGCQQCFYYTEPLHQGDISCAVNPSCTNATTCYFFEAV